MSIKSSYLPSIGRLLGFSSGLTTTLSSRRLKPHGITMQQWIVLTALWRTDALGESDLAQYCKTTPSATNRLIDRMVKAGLVQRSADPEDGRRVVVSLGPEGEARRSLLTFYEDINDTLLAGFSASETLQLAALLERLIENAKAAIELDAR